MYEDYYCDANHRNLLVYVCCSVFKAVVLIMVVALLCHKAYNKGVLDGELIASQEYEEEITRWNIRSILRRMNHDTSD